MTMHAVLITPNGSVLSHSATALPATLDPHDGPAVVSWALAEWGFEDGSDDPDRNPDLDWSVRVETATETVAEHNFNN